jgi:hypothetical protein
VHATAAWAIAGILTHEYPGLLTKILAYGTATAVSLSRVGSQQHYPSDVAVGAAIGWLVSRNVYLSHHDFEIGGGSWDSPLGVSGSVDRKIGRPGSAFVPLDSWIYPLFERLVGWGYINTALMGLKPWTRLECARLTDEASESLRREETPNRQALALQSRLLEGFSYELGVMSGDRNVSARVESIYARTVSISGPALTDGYHFGQTVAYDFGRPFERGTNGQAGGSVRATAGPLAVYVRLEYQHAPSAPAPSDAVRNVIAQEDGVPLSEVASTAVGAINRLEVLDA